MKNHKQLLMDFYLNLLCIPHDNPFRSNHQDLYAIVRYVLADELQVDEDDVQRIFERMVREDHD